MTRRRLGLLASLCLACPGEDPPSQDGSSESTSSSSSSEESSSSSTTEPMTTTPPTTSTTEMADTTESSSGEPPCTDDLQGHLSRYPTFQLLEGASTTFTDVGLISGDRYMVGEASPAPDEPLAPTLFIINEFEVEDTLMADASADTRVDRLVVLPDGMGSRVLTQRTASEVEVFDPGDFFNSVGVYQEMEAATRLYDAVAVEDTLWGVGYVEGTGGNNRWLVTSSDDGGATWTMASIFELAADQGAEARVVAHHADAGALVIGGIAADKTANWHVRLVELDDTANSLALDTVPEGSVHAIEIIDGRVFVAGDVGGFWRVRMADPVGADFIDLDDGSGIEAVKSTVVDLAVGPAGELLALGTVTPNEGNDQALMILRACADPTMGPDCWTTIIEPEQMFVGESVLPTRMLVDDDGVWIVGSVVDVDEDLGNEGAVFHLACPD